MSAYRDRPLPPASVFFGEVGLAGEVRGVSRAEDRVREAKKLGFKRAFLPARQAAAIRPGGGFELVGVASLVEFIDSLGR